MPGWRELIRPVEYTGEVTDSFDYHEIWHSGEVPPSAEVTHTNPNNIFGTTIYECARGTSREQVEELLRETASRLKVEKAGIS